MGRFLNNSKVFVSLLVANALCLPACRTWRIGNSLQSSNEVSGAIDLMQAPAVDVAEVCMQRQFFFYVGNAESLGKVYTPKGLEQFFNTKSSWQEAEWSREWSYFGKVRQQYANLTAAFSRPPAACFRPDVTKIIKESGKLGSITLVGLIDGPNISGPNGTPNEHGDSYIQSWNFGFTNVDSPQMGWQVRGPYFWRIGKGHLDPNPITSLASSEVPQNIADYLSEATADVTFEVIVPDAIDAVIASREVIGALHFTDGRAFTQTHYAFKSHGAQIAPGDIFRTEPDEGTVISRQFSPFSESALLFDSFGKIEGTSRNGWNEESSDFVQPLWSSLAICRLNVVGIAPNLIVQDKAAVEACVHQMEAKATGDGSVDRAPQGAGNPGNDQGAGNPGNDQGAGNPGNDQGAGNPGNDQGAGNPGNDQGAGNPGNDQGAGDPGNDQAISGLVLGPNFWMGATQGSKGFVFRSSQAARSAELSPAMSVYNQYGLNAYTIRNRDQRKDPVISMATESSQTGTTNVTTGQSINFEPQSFRLLGKAKSLSFRAQEKDRLRVAMGTSQPGIVILDTCYGNLSPGKPTATMGLDKTLNTILPWRDENNTAGIGSALVLANPLPLLIDAIDYRALDAFQYSFLAIDQVRTAGSRVTDNALRVMRGPAKPLPKDSTELKSRLLAGVTKCGAGDDPECRLTRGNWDIMAWDRLYFMTMALAHVGQKNDPSTAEIVDGRAYFDASQFLILGLSIGDLQQMALRVTQQVYIANLRANKLRLLTATGNGADIVASYLKARSVWSKLSAAYFSELQKRLETKGYDSEVKRIVYSKQAFLLTYLSLTLLADPENAAFGSLDESVDFKAGAQSDEEKKNNATNFRRIWEIYKAVIAANPPIDDEARQYHADIANIAPDAEFLTKLNSAIAAHQFKEIGEMAVARLKVLADQ